MSHAAFIFCGSCAKVGKSKPTWAIASFSKPVVLFAQPYWLMLNATQGSALWLSQSATGRVQIIDNPMQFQLGQSTNALEDLSGLYHWLSPNTPDAADADPQTSDAASTLQVSVAAQSLQGTLLNGKRRYDLTASLNQLNTPPATTSTEGLIAVTFSMTSTGSITVYPPRIVFTNAAIMA